MHAFIINGGGGNRGSRGSRGNRGVFAMRTSWQKRIVTNIGYAHLACVIGCSVEPSVCVAFLLIHTYRLTHIRTYTRTDSHTHTYVHTYIHT